MNHHFISKLQIKYHYNSITGSWEKSFKKTFYCSLYKTLDTLCLDPIDSGVFICKQHISGIIFIRYAQNWKIGKPNNLYLHFHNWFLRTNNFPHYRLCYTLDLWDLHLDKYKSTYLNDVILWNSGTFSWININQHIPMMLYFGPLRPSLG